MQKIKIKIKDKLRITKNIISFIVIFSSKTISSIIYLPLMFYFWGLESTGIWIFLNSTINFVNIINLNSNQYSFQKIILIDKKKINELYSNSFIISALASFFLSIFLIIFYIFFLTSLDILQTIDKNDFIYICPALIIIFNVNNLCRFFYIHFYYKGRLDLINYCEESYDFFLKIIIAISGLFFFKIKDLILINLFLVIIYFLILLLIINKSSILRLKINKIKFQIFLRIFKKGLNYNYLNLTNIINYSLLNFAIGIFFTSEILSMVNALQTLFKSIATRIISIINQTLIYELPLFLRKKNIMIVNLLLKNQKYITGVIILFLLIFSFFFGEMIFDKWTSGKFLNYSHLMWLIIFEAVTYIQFNNNLNFFKSINKVETFAINILFSNILVISITFILLMLYENIQIIFLLLILKNISLTIYLNKFKKNNLLL